jgi:hypothetical protein
MSILIFFKGLFINGVGGGSLGRVSFWLLFSLALYIFWQGKEISTYHFWLVVACLGYQLTGKFSTNPFFKKGAK